MGKLELSPEHFEKINYAVISGLGMQNWQAIQLLSGGLTGVPVYKIQVQEKYYVVKLEDPNDSNFNLVRNYEMIKAVSKQGICPTIYFTDASKGIILMLYIEAKRPDASEQNLQKLVSVTRKLHDENSFLPWIKVTNVFDNNYQKLPYLYKEVRVINKCMAAIKEMEDVLFDPKDLRSCHADLNPANVLFDGVNYFLVDWQAASLQSFYFDLACIATWFYFSNENFCDLLLRTYLAREEREDEKAKYYLMRIFTLVYFGIGFILLPLKTDVDYPALDEKTIEKLSNLPSFFQSIGKGEANLSDNCTQRQFGFILLNTAEKMMESEIYQEYCSLLKTSQRNNFSLK